MRVYLDHAATTPLLPEVKKEMIQIMEECYGNPSSIHHFGRQAKTHIETARKKIAQAFQVSIGEIFFTSGATEANNMVLIQSVETLGKNVILYSPIEHHCVLHTIQYLQKYKGVQAISLTVNERGEIDMDEAESLIHKYGDQAILVAMYANNEIGVIQDIQTLGVICKRNGTLFHSDTVQMIGKYPLEFEKLHLTFASGSAHKFFGPKGVGFVYINSQHPIHPFIHGGSQERNMRAGTENIYGIVGMASALEIAIKEMVARHAYVSELKNYFKERLQNELDDIVFNGSPNSLYNILSVSFPQSEKANLLVMNMDIAGICASSGSACSSGVEEDSHVLKAIGHNPKRKTIRFSLSHLNTYDEIDYTVEKLKSMTPASVG